MGVERYESIIDVQYLGQQDVSKYIDDLRRVGAITEQVQAQLKAALAGGLGGSSDELRRALGVGAAGMRDYDAAAAKALSTTERQAAATGRLRSEVDRLQASMARLQSTQAQGSQTPPPVEAREARRALYGVLQSNAIQQRVAQSASVPLRELGTASTTSRASSQLDARDLADRQAHLQRRIQIERQIEQRLEAQRDAILPAREPLALNPGPYAGLAYSNRPQEDPTRSARYQQAIDRAIARRESSSGYEAVNATFAPGGTTTSIEFQRKATDISARLLQLDVQIAKFNLEVEAATARFVASTRNRTAAAAQAQSANSDALEALLNRARIESRGGSNVNALLGTADVVPNRFYDRTGQANREMLSSLSSPESRAALVGEFAGDPLQEYAPLLRSLRNGIPVPGATNVDDVLHQNAYDDPAVAAARGRLEFQQQLRALETSKAGEFARPPELEQRAASTRAQDAREVAAALAEVAAAEARGAAAAERAAAATRAQLALERQRASIASLLNARSEAANGPRALPAAPTRLALPGPDGAYQISGVGGVPPGRVPPVAPGPADDGGGLDPLRADLEAIHSLGQEVAATRVQQAQAARAAAGVAYDKVVDKYELPLGDKGGFKDAEERKAALARAYKAAEAAQTRLNSEIEKEATARKAAAEAFVRATTEAAAAERQVADAARAEAAQRRQAAASASQGASPYALGVGPEGQAQLDREALASSAGGGVVPPTTARRGVGGFADGFKKGFVGENNSASYAEQVGQTFKFSVLYGSAYQILSGITQTLSATLNEGIAFQQAIVELRLASGDAGGYMESIANTLGDNATEAGFAPSAGVLVGARSLGLFGATNAPEAEQAQTADISSRVASRLALSAGNGTQPADVQTNIAAITQAFGLGAQGQQRVADLDAYFGKKFGVAPGQSIQAVAEAGNVASAAGFSQEETTAIASLLQGRTGQTASAVAGYMAQIFSRGGEGSLTGLLGRYGIDPNSTLKDQLYGLGQVYQKADPNEQNEIAATFGRGKVQNAVTALLEGLPEVAKAAADSRGPDGASGSADQAFNERIQTLGGQIAVTIGILKEAAGALGQSGILDITGAAVVSLRELVSAGTGVINLFGELDGKLKLAILGLALLSSSAVRGAAANAASGVLNRANFAISTGASTAGAVRAGLFGGATGFGVAATAAIGGLLALGALKNKSDQLGEAQDRVSRALEQGLGADATADQLRGRASELRTTAQQTRDDSNGFVASLTSQFLDGGDTKATNLSLAKAADQEADRLDQVASIREQAAARAAAAGGSSVDLIDNFDPASLDTALKLITDSGGTAADQLDALVDSLGGTAKAAKNAKDAFDLGLFGQESGAAVSGAIDDTAYLYQQQPKNNFLATVNVLDKAISFGQSDALDGDYQNNASSILRDAGVLDPGKLGAAAASALAEQGVKGPKDFTADKVRRAATEVVNNSGFDQALRDAAPDLSPLEITPVIEDNRQRLIAAVEKSITDQAEGLVTFVNEGTSLSAEGLTALASRVSSIATEVANSKQGSDFDGKAAALKQGINAIRAAIRRTPTGVTNSALEQLTTLRRTMAENQIEQLDGARKLAQQNARGEAAIAGVGRRFFGKEVRAAIRGGATDKLVELIGMTGAYGKRVALDSINDAIQVQRAAAREERELRAFLATVNLSQGVLTGSDTDVTSQRGQNIVGAITGATNDIKEGRNKLEGLLGIRDAIKDALSGDKDSDPFLTGNDVPGVEQADAEAEKPTETAAQRRAALASANATRSESSIQAAKAAILSARANMAAAEKGTIEYYSALESLYAAQNSLTDAVLDYQSNKLLLGIDSTDPLEQAKVALRVAQAKLRSDAGKGADVKAADRVALQDAQASLEATKFEQRLSSVQTAEQLGRISHGAYIRYLDNEHDRLNKIKNRTYQQQQQLNEIDGLLQDAAKELQGQFNFGNIDLPTPYEVRRYIEQSSGAASTRALAAGRSGGSNTTTIYIDGADVGKVRRIVEDVTGQKARTTTTAPRRR